MVVWQISDFQNLLWITALLFVLFCFVLFLFFIFIFLFNFCFKIVAKGAVINLSERNMKRGKCEKKFWNLIFLCYSIFVHELVIKEPCRLIVKNSSRNCGGLLLFSWWLKNWVDKASLIWSNLFMTPDD